MFEEVLQRISVGERVTGSTAMFKGVTVEERAKGIIEMFKRITVGERVKRITVGERVKEITVCRDNRKQRRLLFYRG